ncbi:hypothetical protein SCP_0704670 [Sparassis crispa]|uniref:Cep57 centrosome microtubule-binding domain-containing protein n=1 Tax=Sparassis crispa TaxID=139825 RepID=A0A401GSX8_9APHY|nr:hypothetical protein SCP_0704670 [Sparassis crispa]GBE85280.1 hypothetical protein SCP_0704670 [Sparassis crispa]
MSRHPANFEFSIRGDELEQNRIQLEHNLQHTDLSLHLSSTPDDDTDVEYPRHNSAPSPFVVSPPFGHHSEDHLQPAEQSQYHAWSYRTLEEDGDGVAPYAMSTISTAAHHASALTLSAGLGGRRTRRDISMSGAEYDPDRPLHGIMAGMNGYLSNIDINSTMSNHMMSAATDFDPVVVDDTAEIDRILQSGHTGVVVRSPDCSSSATSDSEPASLRSNTRSPRPKLSDALHKVAFSPKRPRSAQAHLSPHSRPHSSLVPLFGTAHPTLRARPPPTTLGSEADAPTPRPRQVSRNQSLSYVQESMPRNRSAAAMHDKDRNPFGDVGNQMAPERAPPVKIPSQTPLKGKVYLPDVTGLTEAIATPVKIDPDYHGYKARKDGECEARLLATLNLVQAKLAFLESENSTTRRRVRELEVELEACKHEVAKERTKMIAREEVMAPPHADITSKERHRFTNAGRLQKGKAQVRVDDRDMSANESRYKEVVEEKKALEALITTLRAHLSRLTAELSDHQRLLIELRTLRDCDVRSLADKSKDVDQLRREVERLAGEVDVLKGVIEEGLKERRIAKERSSFKCEEDTPEHSVATQTIPQVDAPDRQALMSTSSTNTEEADEDEDEGEDETSGSSRRLSPSPSPKEHALFTERTIRTDHATVGSLQFASSTNARQSVDTAELERISAEVEERRSERSSSVHSPALSRPHSRLSERSASPLLSRPASRIASTSNSSQVVDDVQRAPSPTSPMDGPSRPPAPTPRVSGKVRMSEETRSPSGKPCSEQQQAVEPETPFPQIRGARLERLFFSAPEHNVETCTICHRRRRKRCLPLEQIPSWMAGRPPHDFRARMQDQDDDEGFVDGSDEDEDLVDSRHGGKGTAPERQGWSGKSPPQTVLVRVLRELEDDFTHYKGIYVELADQYKVMDPTSNVVKRNVLAEHLREIIDILEQKGDQIASLYDLLTFNDKPTRQSVIPDRSQRHAPNAKRSMPGRSRGIARQATLP